MVKKRNTEISFNFVMKMCVPICKTRVHISNMVPYSPVFDIRHGTYGGRGVKNICFLLTLLEFQLALEFMSILKIFQTSEHSCNI